MEFEGQEERMADFCADVLGAEIVNNPIQI